MTRTLMIPLAFALLLLGCKGDTSLQRLSDYDLAEKHKECTARKPSAPGAILACNNIRDECERRHKALGNYMCRG